jgi:hypothetical protein
MRSAWLPVLLIGCAHAPSVTSEQVVRLPPQARQQIVEGRRSVDVADQNFTAAEVALDEAKRFREVADRELDAAKAHADAAQRSLDLGTSSFSQGTLRSAREGRELAVRELFAARGKRDYADRLIDLRKAEVELRRAERESARADFEYLKYTQLRAHGQSRDLKEADFLAARDRAQHDVADARGRVAGLQGNVEALRTAWLLRAQDLQSASRGVDVPPPPPPLPVPRTFTPPPAGGANEGPSAPQSLPSD